MVQFLQTKIMMNFFCVLHASESDADCSRSPKYVSKLVKDFLDEPVQKTATPKSFAYHHMMTSFMEFFNSPICLSVGVESLFLIGLKTFFAQRGQAMRIFIRLCFSKKIINFLFINLVTCIICFKYWLRTVV